jgi:hypothetical protein
LFTLLSEQTLDDDLTHSELFSSKNSSNSNVYKAIQENLFSLNKSVVEVINYMKNK